MKKIPFCENVPPYIADIQRGIEKPQDGLGSTKYVPQWLGAICVIAHALN